MNEKTDHSALADVSVVMPAWRAAPTIGRALSSIAAQTLRPREVIVVDDGSDDGTCAAAEALAPVLAPTTLKVFRQQNAGPGAARNRAISEATSGLLAFLDADDEWLPEKLEISVGALADPGAVLVAHNIVVQDGERQDRLDCARHLPSGGDAFAALFKRGFVATSSVVCRRDAVDAAGRFDESLPSGQDYELWLAIARFDPRRFVMLPDYVTRYHVVPNSVTSRTELRRRCAIRIVRRHAAGLRRRVRNPVGVVFFRLAVIAAEATSAMRRKNGTVRALGPLLRLPALLVASVFWLFSETAEQNGAAPRGTAV